MGWAVKLLFYFYCLMKQQSSCWFFFWVMSSLWILFCSTSEKTGKCISRVLFQHSPSSYTEIHIRNASFRRSTIVVNEQITQNLCVKLGANPIASAIVKLYLTIRLLQSNHCWRQEGRIISIINSFNTCSSTKPSSVLFDYHLLPSWIQYVHLR